MEHELRVVPKRGDGAGVFVCGGPHLGGSGMVPEHSWCLLPSAR